MINDHIIRLHLGCEGREEYNKFLRDVTNFISEHGYEPYDLYTQEQGKGCSIHSYSYRFFERPCIDFHYYSDHSGINLRVNGEYFYKTISLDLSDWPKGEAFKLYNLMVDRLENYFHDP
jgi:hypothetical protein